MIRVAQKLWCANEKKDSSSSLFMALLPGIYESEFNRLEVKLLALFDFAAGISVQRYTSCYFRLRDLFKEVTGDCIDWEGGPLSIIGAKKLGHIPLLRN